MTAPQAKRNKQIVGLDLVRGLAALLVLCFHWGYYMFRGLAGHPPVPPAYRPFTPLFSRGWSGVEVFFVLSGFVIAYSTQGSSAKRFLVHRIRRLLPTALICATLTAALLLRAYPWRDVALEWLRSVTFFPVGPWVDGAYWTLPIEVTFYMVVCVTLTVQRGRISQP